MSQEIAKWLIPLIICLFNIFVWRLGIKIRSEKRFVHKSVWISPPPINLMCAVLVGFVAIFEFVKTYF